MSGANPNQTRFADYLEVFQDLNTAGGSGIIVAGQAVNFWAELFQAEEPEIRDFAPFTSVDLDLHQLNAAGAKLLKSRASMKESQLDPFGKAFTIVSHTLAIETKVGRTVKVQALKTVSGLRPHEIEKGTLELQADGINIRVLNPIACLKAKMYNVQTIDQRYRQDEKHVRVLFPCVRAFIRGLLREAETSGNRRPVLNALNQVLEMTIERKFLKTARDLALDLGHLLPVSDLRSSTNPKILNFTTKLLPQWQTRIAGELR